MGESGENTNEWITEFRTMLEKENRRCFWPYKKLNSERGIKPDRAAKKLMI